MKDSAYISCQINFYPLYTMDVNEEVKEVIDIIDKSGLKYKSGDLSTAVYGYSGEVYSLLEEITEILQQNDRLFSMNISISNSCGCKVE
ncbi:MAG: YkoF family thiamine/hydroxymethylpyrimidine-binding protein [Bacillota bacterium]